MWEEELERLLQNEFERYRAQNPRYSMRAYAKRLAISPATLSQILRGKRAWKLQVQTAASIVDHMEVSLDERQRILARMGLLPGDQRKPFPKDDYALLTDWTYLAVLLAHDLPVEHRTPAALSDRFGLPESQIRKIRAELKVKSLLKENDSGVWERCSDSDQLLAGDGPTDEIIQAHHKNNMTLAMRAVDELSAECRDFSSLTFVGNSKTVTEIRKEIRLFHEKIKALMNRGDDNDQVFRMSVFLFPMDFEQEVNTP